MALTFTSLHPVFAAEICGIDLRKATEASVLDEIRAGMDTYAVLVFRGQQISAQDQLSFAKRLDGELHTKTGASALTKNRHGDEALADISNVDGDGKLLKPEDRRRMYSLGNRLWHTDASFQDPAGRYSMLYARVVPEGGPDTEFCDTRAAYDTLPDKLKNEIDGLEAHHSIAHSRMTLGFDFSESEQDVLKGAIHPLVRVNPNNGRKSTYVASHASRILGRPVPEGRLLLADLIEHATAPERVFRHKWQAGDLVIWDNRATMHRALPFDDINQRRELIRVTTLDIEPRAVVLTG